MPAKVGKYNNALIFEDNEELCEMYKQFLLLGLVHVVDIATNIEQSERLILLNQYELWILDWNIKNKTASVLLNSDVIKKKMPKLILIITADLDNKDLIQSNGCNYEILFKPFPLDELEKKLIR